MNIRLKMSVFNGFILLTVLCVWIGGTAAVCEPKRNEDMIEYSCVGGYPSDLNMLPEGTGKIRIYDMPLRRITADTFSRFGSELWVLICSHCDIVDIEPGAFRHLRNLQHLSLDNNHLTVVRASWFKGLDYLTYLDLNYNDIRMVEEGVFSNVPALVDLRLSGNRLECLNLNDMSNLKELKRMFLNENPEFKCPNAVSNFLAEQGVNFDKDPIWRKLPNDLVSPIFSSADSIKVPTTKMPSFREWLHSTTTTTHETPRTVPYSPPMINPVEEVVSFLERTTPEWKSTQQTYVDLESASSPKVSDYWHTTESYYERPKEPSELPNVSVPTEYSEQHSSHVSPSTDSNPVFSKYSPDATSAESSSSESTLYPQHENENKPYEQPVYPNEGTRPMWPATSQIDRHEPPGFVEPNMEHTTGPYNVPPIPEESGSLSIPQEDGDAPEQWSPESKATDAETHIIRPLPYSPPEVHRTYSPDDFMHGPDEDSAVMVPSPPLENYHQPDEEISEDVLPIETTTDKPLPACPNAASAPIMYSFRILWSTVLLIVVKNIITEGY